MIDRIDLRDLDPSAADAPRRLAPMVAHLRAGGVIAYPTETVYGFGSTIDPGAVLRLREMKRRPDAKPVLALISGPSGAPELEWTDAARELATLFWPGALTMILSDPTGRFPDGARDERGGVAVRHTPHPLAAALVDALGAPLTSSSANAPGRPPAMDGDEAVAALEELAPDHRVLVVDGGRLPPSASSTLVDCRGAVPVVLREGAIPIDRLRCAIPEIAAGGGGGA